MTARNVTFYSPKGRAMYGGRVAPNVGASGFTFDSVVDKTGSGTDPTNMVILVTLHGSGGQNYEIGRRYEAQCSGALAYSEHTKFFFSGAKHTAPGVYTYRPIDEYTTISDGDKRESMWLGMQNIPDPSVRLITEHRLDAMMDWIIANIPNTAQMAAKRCLTGGSMGGWGSVTYGLRRPHYFAAVYPDRPRWSCTWVQGTISVCDYTAGGVRTVNISSSPMLSAEDGGGKYSDYIDMVAYVANPANKLPWVGWCIGRDDRYGNFQDQINAVDALRATKRGFAFAWNNGNHSGGSIMSEITKSYPFGTFSIGKGYPLFTEHSLDKDPRVDLVGGINIGLTFRNVVENASGWSCEVTSVTGACTVKVEPISDIFKAAVAPQLVTIPAANSWVPVSFTA